MECLVTKLKGVVSDSSLLKLNELRLTFTNDSSEFQAVTIQFVEKTTITALNGGLISLQKDSGYSSSIEVTTDAVSVYFKQGDTEISIPDKTKLRQINAATHNNIYIKNLNIDTLKYCTNLYAFSVYVDENVYGDIGSLKNISRLNEIRLYSKTSSGNIIGDISFLDNVDIKALLRVDGGISGELSKITQYIQLDTVSPNSTAKVNITSEENVDTSCRGLMLNCDVEALDFSFLEKTNLNDFSSLSTSRSRDKNFSGDICALAKAKNTSAGEIFLKQAKGTSEQKLSELPNAVYFVTTASSNLDYANVLPLTWTSNTESRTDIIALEGAHFKSGTAQFIKDMAGLNNAHTSQSYYQKIDIKLADDLTSSAASSDGELQSAISTLQGKGVTVSIGYSDTAANGIALMSALDVNASKYGIVYKGKELIIT